MAKARLRRRKADNSLLGRFTSTQKALTAAAALVVLGFTAYDWLHTHFETALEAANTRMECKEMKAELKQSIGKLWEAVSKLRDRSH